MTWTLVGMLQAPTRQLAETSFPASLQRHVRMTRQRPTPVRLADESQMMNVERQSRGCKLEAETCLSCPGSGPTLGSRQTASISPVAGLSHTFMATRASRYHGKGKTAKRRIYPPAKQEVSQPARRTIRRQKPRFLHSPSCCPAAPTLILTLLSLSPSSPHFVFAQKALLRRLRDSHPIVAAGPGQDRVRPARFLAHATHFLEERIHSSAYKLAPTRSLPRPPLSRVWRFSHHRSASRPLNQSAEYVRTKL
ncbi:hypothetical protein V8C44DRAFT_122978 [Trichoderma aethiopicum]